ncbi:hypothetical protein LCM30_17355 [Halobacillus litoralis]|nr:hypothetical protein [Halobacillus litoralis]
MLRNVLDAQSSSNIDGEILILFFNEGGFLTTQGIYYVKIGDSYFPVGQTDSDGKITVYL